MEVEKEDPGRKNSIIEHIHIRLFLSYAPGHQYVKTYPKVIWDEVREAQRKVRGHLRALNLIFIPGKIRL